MKATEERVCDLLIDIALNQPVDTDMIIDEFTERFPKEFDLKDLDESVEARSGVMKFLHSEYSSEYSNSDCCILWYKLEETIMCFFEEVEEEV